MKKTKYIILSVFFGLLFIAFTMVAIVVPPIGQSMTNLSQEISATVNDVIDMGNDSTGIRIYTDELPGFLSVQPSFANNKSKEDFLNIQKGEKIYFTTIDGMELMDFCIVCTLRTENQEYISMDDYLDYSQRQGGSGNIISICAAIFFLVVAIASSIKLKKCTHVKKHVNL